MRLNEWVIAKCGRGRKDFHVPQHGVRIVPVLVLRNPHPAASTHTPTCMPKGARTPESALEVWPHARRAKVCLSFLNICGASLETRYGLFACTSFCGTAGMIRSKD